MPSKSDQKEEFVDHVDPLESRTSARGWKIRVPLPPRCDDKLRDFHRKGGGGQFRRSKQQRTHEERKKKEGENDRRGRERERERNGSREKKRYSWKTRAKREEERGNWRGFDVTLINPRCLSFRWSDKSRSLDNSDIKIH